jgi:hypothetical protein
MFSPYPFGVARHGRNRRRGVEMLGDGEVSSAAQRNPLQVAAETSVYGDTKRIRRSRGSIAGAAVDGCRAADTWRCRGSHRPAGAYRRHDSQPDAHRELTGHRRDGSAGAR